MVRNNLIELFNLITLLKPGTLKTEAGFRSEYIKRGRLQEPSHPEKLRELSADPPFSESVADLNGDQTERVSIPRRRHYQHARVRA